jgi:outer membrane protein assembly factor BamD
MKKWLQLPCLIALGVLAFPFRAPAPLIYTPGEGWSYESVGEGKWQKLRAKDQLEVAQGAFDKKDYSLALKASRRVVKVWPLSDYAPQGQYLTARCYEQKGQDERGFDAYQKVLQKYPKAGNYEEILQREFAICNRFLAGEHFKLWNYIPTFPSMEKTVTMYQKLIKNGPYSDVAVQAQMNIGAARERQTRFLNDKEPLLQAAKAYELAADRYHDRPKVAADATYKAFLAYNKEAETAEYDQGTAVQAMETFTQFATYYPDDARVKDGEKLIAALQTEQARGNFQIARFYERSRHWKSALIYYNEVLIKDPKSSYAAASLKRIAALKQLTEK